MVSSDVNVVRKEIDFTSSNVKSDEWGAKSGGSVFVTNFHYGGGSRKEISDKSFKIRQEISN